MSQVAHADWALQEARRRQIYLERQAEIARNFAAGYRHALADLESTGLAEFVRSEVDRLAAAVAGVEQLADQDPEAAQAQAYRLGSAVHALPAMAHTARRHAEQLEREQERQRAIEARRERDASHGAWAKEVGNWNDPLASALAYTELAELRQRFFAGGQARAPQAEVRKAVDEVRARAIQAADQQRNSAAGQAAEQVRQQQARQAVEVLEQTSGTSQATKARLQQLNRQLPSLQGKAVLQAVATAQADVNALVVDERCRKEAVRAVMGALRTSGFVVDAPYLQAVGDHDEVVVRAARPSGNRAEFRVRVEGDLTWHFDGYKGAACKKDLDVVLPRLADIYGVKLSEKRVVCQNPDDQSVQRNELPDAAAREDRHGDA